MPFSESELQKLGFFEWPDGSWKKEPPPLPEPAAVGPRIAADNMLEIRDLHDPFKTILEARRIVYIYSRPDRPTGQRTGLPDFCMVVAGVPIAIEFKVVGKKPRKTQRECIAAMEANGWNVLVSSSVQEAWQFVRDLAPTAGA